MAKQKLNTGASYDDSSAEAIKDSFDKLKIVIDENYEADSRIGSPISFNRPSGSWHNTPNNPFIDTIPILLISDGDNILTGENNDSREGNTVGVWLSTSNTVVAYTGFTNQILKSGEPIPDELCLVWLTYYKSGNLIIQDIQTFDPPYILNETPVITLLGGANINHTIGQPYSDSGATAVDTEDGDITGDIVVGGDTVDVNTLGTYNITFDVQDSNGASAPTVTRIVNVVALGAETSPILVVETSPILVVTT